VALGDPFDLVGDGEIGVVCVHGFTGTPYEVRYLGGELARAGFTVHGLRLPGHGTRVADLDATRWTDWADAVEDAFDTLAMLCRRVAVVGQSLGGLLALHLASRRPEVAAVGSLATPLWLDGLAGRVAELVLRSVVPAEAGPEAQHPRRMWSRAAGGVLQRIEAIPKLYGSDCRDRRTRRENPCYDAIPTRALAELATFMKITGGALERVSQPVIVLHARRDHTAPVACAAEIARRTRARRTRILERSYHLIAADVERDIVAAEVTTFLRRNCSPPANPS
jgi:carboxylesterase